MYKLYLVILASLIISPAYADTCAIQVQNETATVYTKGNYDIAEDDSQAGDTFEVGSWDGDVFTEKAGMGERGSVQNFLPLVETTYQYIDGNKYLDMRRYNDSELEFKLYYHYNGEGGIHITYTYTLRRL